MASRFLVAGGDGNWNNNNNWAATSGAASGASFPVAGDTVAFDSLSGNANMTVNVASACTSLIMSGTYAGTLTFNSTLTVSGTVTFLAACTIAGTTGTLILFAAATITSGGKTLTCALSLQPGIATITLADNWTVNGLFSAGWTAGQTTINGNQITCNGGYSQLASSVIVGTTKLVLTGGTWSSTSASRTANNIDLAGNVTVSGSVIFGGGTLKYVSGTITTTGSTLTLSAVSTLDTAGITWNTVNFTGGVVTYTFTSALVAAGLVTFSNNNTTTINGSQITCAGGLAMTGVSTSANGTTKLVITGGTWSQSAGNGYRVSVDFAGNVTVSGTVICQGATLTYVSGTITTTGSTLRITNAATTLATAGMTWNNVIFAATSNTITLTNNLAWSGTLDFNQPTVIAGAGTLSGTGAVTFSTGASLTLNNTGGLVTTGTMALLDGVYTFAGTAGWTVGTLTTATLTASRIHTLTFGNTYTVTTSLANVGTTAAIRQALKSSSPGNKVVFTLGPAATQQLAFCDPTDVDSSGGQTVVSVAGTITTSINWVGSVPSGGGSPVTGYAFI